MDRLYTSIDTLVDDVCEGLRKPKEIAKAVNDCDVPMQLPEAEKLMEKILSSFRKTCQERISKFIQDTEIESKLQDLQALSQECEERNAELGVELGYRPVCPKLDMEGALQPVASKYHESLSSADAKLKDEISKARILLKDATERVDMLAKVAEEMMESS
ncbi:hypothetical protein Q1695_011361 [Nippostrongylus brasiliensis]|nr:hypothetical protein Q1695_011361 [Nippostrongylus brasiliensis]